MIGALEDRDKLARETATKPQDVLEHQALVKVSMAAGMLHLGDDAAGRVQVCVTFELQNQHPEKKNSKDSNENQWSLADVMFGTSGRGYLIR